MILINDLPVVRFKLEKKSVIQSFHFKKGELKTARDLSYDKLSRKSVLSFKKKRFLLPNFKIDFDHNLYLPAQ